jgi:hypothetical protein
MLDKRKEQNDGQMPDVAVPETSAFPDVNFDGSAVSGNGSKDDLPF